MAHKLNFYIDEATDCSVFAIGDVSTYDSLLPIEDLALKMEVPGYQCGIMLTYAKNRTNYYDSSSLSSVCSNCLEFPDGVYKFTLSVCPSDLVFESKYYFRDCKLRCLIYSKLSINNCTEYVDCIGNVVNISDQVSDCLRLLDSAKSDACVNRIDEAMLKYQYVYQKALTL